MFLAQPNGEKDENTSLSSSDLSTFLKRKCQAQNTVQPDRRRLRPCASYVKLSILMPAYNEESPIIRAIEEIFNVDYPREFEIIVVDDGSSDATGLLLSQVREDRIVVHRHPVNMGKGAALRSAAYLATGTHGDPFDADLEYVAEDIPRMLEPVILGLSRSEKIQGDGEAV